MNTNMKYELILLLLVICTSCYTQTQQKFNLDFETYDTNGNKTEHTYYLWDNSINDRGMSLKTLFYWSEFILMIPMLRRY